MIVETNDGILGKNISYLRNQKRLSRRAFAKRFHLRYTALFCIEKGVLYRIEDTSLQAICADFHVSVSDLLCRELKQK